MLKVIITIFLSILCVNVKAQDSQKFIIEGSIKGLKDYTSLYLVHNTNDSGPDTVARVKARNGKFLFKGVIPVIGEFYFIKIDTVLVKYSKELKGYVSICMESELIKITGNLEDWPQVRISGSVGSLELREIDILQNFYQNKVNDIWRTASAMTEMDVKVKLNTLDNQKDDATLRWINEHSASFVTPVIIKSSYGNNVDAMVRAYERLTKKVKDSYYGVDLKEYIDVLLRTSVGSKASDFTFPTVEGNMLSLDEVVKRSKYTLVDFWASWCKPCRAAFPKLKNLHARYSTRGLNIMGVSIDEDLVAWKNAVVKDSLPWYNVCELNKIASKLYGIDAVPQTYLLDSAGNIITAGLSGKALEKKLAELFKENWQDIERLAKKEEIEFFNKNKQEKRVIQTSSGLQYQILKEGLGQKPTINSQIKVHYIGELMNGKKFYSTIDKGEPGVLSLNGLIKGWTEALLLMPAGSRWKLYIPSELGYGDLEISGIPPASILIFDVELLEVLN